MSQKQQYCLSVAGISLLLETDQFLPDEKAFSPFRAEGNTPDFRIIYRKVSQLPPISDTVVHEDICYRIHPDGKGGYLRSFFAPPRDKTAYAVAQYDYVRGMIQVDYLPKGAHCFSEMRNSFFHLNLEELLIHKERLCLHAACVQTDFGGILFSGPSGIGKSTQAELWCRYRDARQINGDRPILSKDKDGWLVWGSPYAGSSNCYVNACCHVTAIVMLRQAKECGLRRLSQAEAFRSVWSGLTIHSWDDAFVKNACDLTMEMVSTVPVFEFCCTPDEEAVAYLEQGLRKECSL